MEFCVASGILNRQIGLEDFTDKKVSETRTQEMIKKIRVVGDPELTKSKTLPSIVRIKLKNGQEYTHRVDFAKGHPKVPLTREEQVAKYRNCAGMVLSESAVTESLEMIDNLEELEDLSLLASVLMG